MTRLILLIDNDAYDISPLPGGSGVRRAWRLRKLPREEGGAVAVYDVREIGSRLTCDCQDFIYRRKDETRQHCKHSSAIAAYFSPVFAVGQLEVR